MTLTNKLSFVTSIWVLIFLCGLLGFMGITHANECQNQDTYSYRKIEFHPVPVGHFLMGEEGKKKPVTLGQSIEVMSTEVTQHQWTQRMKENPSHFSSGEDAVPINIDGQSIQIKPDHPVESMTWWSALVFANKLSQEHGFTPTYDLSDIVWDPETQASNGTLKAKAVKLESMLQMVITISQRVTDSRQRPSKSICYELPEQ